MFFKNMFSKHLWDLSENIRSAGGVEVWAEREQIKWKDDKIICKNWPFLIILAEAEPVKCRPIDEVKSTQEAADTKFSR